MVGKRNLSICIKWYLPNLIPNYINAFLKCKIFTFTMNKTIFYSIYSKHDNYWMVPPIQSGVYCKKCFSMCNLISVNAYFFWGNQINYTHDIFHRVKLLFSCTVGLQWCNQFKKNNNALLVLNISINLWSKQISFKTVFHWNIVLLSTSWSNNFL